jgi:hypothetical protein
VPLERLIGMERPAFVAQAVEKLNNGCDGIEHIAIKIEFLLPDFAYA